VGFSFALKFRLRKSSLTQIVNKTENAAAMTNTIDVYFGIFTEVMTVQTPIMKPEIWPAICKMAFDKTEGSGKVNSLANPTPHGKMGRIQTPIAIDTLATNH